MTDTHAAEATRAFVHAHPPERAAAAISEGYCPSETHGRFAPLPENREPVTATDVTAHGYCATCDGYYGYAERSDGNHSLYAYWYRGTR